MSLPDSNNVIQLEQLVPVVISRFHLEIPLLQTESENEAHSLRAQFAFVELGEHLAVTVGLRDEFGYQQLTHQQLNSIHLQLDQAVELARDNLLRQDGIFRDGGQFQQIRPGLWILRGNEYVRAAPGLLFVQRIAELPLRGNPIAVVPNSDCLLVTGTAELDAVPEFLKLARHEFVHHDQPISVAPLMLNDCHWQAWHPQQEHPRFQSARSIFQFDQSTNYSEQAELLGPNLLARQMDVHIATYQQMEVTTDENKIEHYSLTIWTDAVDTLLPKTDVVGILPRFSCANSNSGQEVKPELSELEFVEWEWFESNLGSALKETLYYPKRYRIGVKLTDQQWSLVQKNKFKYSAEFLDALLEGQVGMHGEPNARKPTNVLPHVVGGIAAMILLLIGVVVIGLATLRWFAPVNQPQRNSLKQPQGAKEFPRIVESEPEVVESEPIDWNGIRLISSRLAGTERKPAYTDIAPAGGVLVGLRFTKGENWGGAIRAIQPIYLVDNKFHDGQRHGLPGGKSQHEVLAKPGYAVGAIIVRAGLVMDAVQVEFHRLENGRLKPEDSYRSQWIGSEGGQLYKPIKSNGRPVAGISGSFQKDHLGIRLWFVDEESCE